MIDCGDADNWSLFGVSGEAAYNPGSYTRGFAVSALRINGVAKNPPSQVPLSDRRLLSFAADAQASSPVWLGCYAGVGQNLYGHLGAALVYPGVIADPDRAAAEAALMARYVS